ncbi:pncF [Streptococcus pneumoniae]|nr:pncF [Streptococcus pneumoniae]
MVFRFGVNNWGFIIGLVVGIFGPYMDDLIRKIFSKSSKKDTDSTL